MIYLQIQFTLISICQMHSKLFNIYKLKKTLFIYIYIMSNYELVQQNKNLRISFLFHLNI